MNSQQSKAKKMTAFSFVWQCKQNSQTYILKNKLECYWLIRNFKKQKQHQQ